MPGSLETIFAVSESPRRQWLGPRSAAAIILGILAAAISLLPDGQSRLIAVAPFLLAALAWWILLRPLHWWIGFAVATLLLPPFPLELGNTGPHLALLFAVLGIWAGVIRLGEWRIRPDTVTVLLVVFTVWLSATALVGAWYTGVTIALLSLARVGLFGIGVWIYLFVVHGPGRLCRIDSFRWASAGFALASVAALWACIDFYYQFPPLTGFAQQYVWLPFGVYRRAQGVFYEAGMLGNLCSMFLVMAAVASAQPEVRKRIASRPLLALGSMVLLAALVLSFSRSSLLHLMTALATLLVLEWRRTHWMSFLGPAVQVLGASAAVVFFWVPEFFRAFWQRLADTVMYAGSYTAELLSGRLETWSLLLEHIADHPLILLTGIGFKTLPYTTYFGEPLVADNMYLSIMVEAGLLGLAIMLALCGAMLAASLRARRGGDPAARFFGTWFLCFWMGQLVQMLSVDVLTYWRVLPLALFVLAMARRASHRAGESAGEGAAT